MVNKIAVVGIWASFLSLYIASYVLAGFKGLAPSLLITAIWAAIAMIIKLDRDKLVEELSCYKAEVWNLRLTVKEMQDTLHEANIRLTYKGGIAVELPAPRETLLRSVFDRTEK